jgi:hypothetical protein
VSVDKIKREIGQHKLHLDQGRKSNEKAIHLVHGDGSDGVPVPSGVHLWIFSTPGLLVLLRRVYYHTNEGQMATFGPTSIMERYTLRC